MTDYELRIMGMGSGEPAIRMRYRMSDTWQVNRPSGNP
jgi:hypothetical protein